MSVRDGAIAGSTETKNIQVIKIFTIHEDYGKFEI